MSLNFFSRNNIESASFLGELSPEFAVYLVLLEVGNDNEDILCKINLGDSSHRRIEILEHEMNVLGVDIRRTTKSFVRVRTSRRNHECECTIIWSGAHVRDF